MGHVCEVKAPMLKALLLLASSHSKFIAFIAGCDRRAEFVLFQPV